MMGVYKSFFCPTRFALFSSISQKYSLCLVAVLNIQKVIWLSFHSFKYLGLMLLVPTLSVSATFFGLVPFFFIATITVYIGVIISFSQNYNSLGISLLVSLLVAFLRTVLLPSGFWLGLIRSVTSDTIHVCRIQINRKQVNYAN